MFNIFKRKKFNSSLYDLELKLDSQQQQINELRQMILQISRDVNSIQLELNYLMDKKYGRGL